MARVATLCPAGIRSDVVTPSATTMPGGRLERAISTPSSGCNRMTGAGAMGCLLFFFTSLRPLRGEVGSHRRCDPGGGARHYANYYHAIRGNRLLTPPSPREE